MHVRNEAWTLTIHTYTLVYCGTVAATSVSTYSRYVQQYGLLCIEGKPPIGAMGREEGVKR